MAQENRLEHAAEDACGRAVAAGGIYRPVIDRYLPHGVGSSHLAIQPGKLSTIEVLSVDHEEADARAEHPGEQRHVRLERVVAFTAHVKRRVRRLVEIVVVAENRVEL